MEKREDEIWKQLDPGLEVTLAYHVGEAWGWGCQGDFEVGRVDPACNSLLGVQPFNAWERFSGWENLELYEAAWGSLGAGLRLYRPLQAAQKATLDVLHRSVFGPAFEGLHLRHLNRGVLLSAWSSSGHWDAWSLH